MSVRSVSSSQIPAYNVDLTTKMNTVVTIRFDVGGEEKKREKKKCAQSDQLISSPRSYDSAMKITVNKCKVFLGTNI